MDRYSSPQVLEPLRSTITVLLRPADAPPQIVMTQPLQFGPAPDISNLEGVADPTPGASADYTFKWLPHKSQAWDARISIAVVCRVADLPN